MIFYFFDTSALVKRYHLEPGTDRVNAIFDTQDSALMISELTLVELAGDRVRIQGVVTHICLRRR